MLFTIRTKSLLHLNIARSNATWEYWYYNGYRSRCLFQEWKSGRSLSVRSPCRSPRTRQSNPGQCAAATFNVNMGPKTTWITWRSILGSYFSCYALLTIASEPCCSKDVGNLTSITVNLTILCNILELKLQKLEESSYFSWTDQWAHPRVSIGQDI